MSGSYFYEDMLDLYKNRAKMWQNNLLEKNKIKLAICQQKTYNSRWSRKMLKNVKNREKMSRKGVPYDR